MLNMGWVVGYCGDVAVSLGIFAYESLMSRDRFYGEK